MRIILNIVRGLLFQHLTFVFSIETNDKCRSSPRYKSNPGERLTLGDMCHIASNVGDKMSQSKEKVFVLY